LLCLQKASSTCFWKWVEGEAEAEDLWCRARRLDQVSSLLGITIGSGGRWTFQN
jgi:hypothetical protein